MRFSWRSEIHEGPTAWIGLAFLLGVGGLGFAAERGEDVGAAELEPTQQAAGKLVYGGGDGRAQDFDIYVGNADGSEITELSHNDVWDSGAVFSPNGKQIAFYSDREGDRSVRPIERNFEIYVMNVDGTDVRRLTDNPAWDGNPSWSPSGRKIAYEACRVGGKCDIYVMNADGTGKTNLTNNDEVWDGAATWSPDSRHIVFSSDRDRDQTLPSGLERGRDLYVMTAAGRNVKRLTQTGYNSLSDWSPDGRIAYQRDDEDDHAIYLMNADGTGQTRLVGGADPVWSPNGREIAFRGNGPEIISADGTNRRRINTSISVRNLQVQDWSAP